ncbi:MAG: lasso peptide biosynthesis B2 protein [Pseudomonadota bacterium]|nr:lasso peptide biosynthesis B2 protein [Pseudomonadota bacterium]
MDSTLNSPTYFLREHAFVCLADRHYVILDLLADMYLRVDKPDYEALACRTSLPWLLSDSSHERGSRELTAESRRLLGELVERGLLTENHGKAQTRAGESVAKPAETLSEVCTPSLGLALRYIFPFVASLRVTTAWLKLPISQTVDRVTDRRRRRAHRSVPFDIDWARVLVSIFGKLRPFWNRKYLCLFDSLALLNFLARYDFFPTWVFGVQSEPFAAHCWVQQNEVLLNDTVDRVSLYTPIMAI